MKIRLKVNDKVTVVAGKDKGKSGKVLQILPENSKVVVEGINTMYKHIKAQQKGEKGQRVQFNGPVTISNLMLICTKCNKASKIGIKVSEDGKQKSRVCKKCNEVID